MSLSSEVKTLIAFGFTGLFSKDTLEETFLLVLKRVSYFRERDQSLSTIGRWLERGLFDQA